MLLGLSKQEVQEWHDSLHNYQKAKRTKRPFGRAVPAVERRSTIDVLEKELRFNPVLQSFRDVREQSRTIQQEELQRANQQMKYLRNEYKHATDYDIITLGQNPLAPIVPNRSVSLAREVRKKQHKDPIFQGFNIISGRHYDQGYLQKVGFREQNHHDRNLHPEQPRNYNIITGRYGHDHEQRQAVEKAEQGRHALEKEQKVRVYDTVNSQYYNPETQSQYQHQRKQKEIEHALTPPQLPPSYINREEYVQADLTVPSQTMLELDHKAAQAKQRYKLRRAVEDEQRMRGEYLSAKSELQARKRVQSGRLMEERSREFDIINAERYLSGRPEEVFGKEVVSSLGKSSLIKSRGFSQF